MDPNATLKEMLELAADIIKSSDEYPADLVAAVRLAEAVDALNGWIMNGGFMPKAWREANEGFNKNPNFDPVSSGSTECDECGESIPDDEPNMVNANHDESCSLHPKNVV